MAKPDKVFGQVGNDPFSAAIEPRRNTLNKWAICAIFMMSLSLRTIQRRSAAQLQC